MTDGFAEFYSANFQRVAAQLYAYVGSHSEAQDLTQEAFCRALDHWGKVSTYENGPAWVRQVAWNLATSRLRHLRVAALHLARQRMDHADGPNPDRVALIRALATLPHNHRTAVVLHYIGELSTSEIAAQCGVADGTVRSWLSRGRAELAERLVDWNEAKDVAFKPEDVATVTAKVKRRRAVRRTTIAAVLLALLAPVVFFVLTKTPSHPPVIGPTTPPPTTSPSPSAVPIATRTIAIPGITLKDRPDVQFVDGRHAWLWYDGCRAPDPVPDCGHVLAASEDGGTTWRTVKLPQLPKRSTVVMFPLDASTLAFRVTQEMADTPTNYWLTTDGGATFASYPLSNPPRLALLAAAGEFYFRCPGATGLEDGAWGVTCDKEELARAGRGRVTPQPPLRSAAMVLNGADGRVWLVDDSEPRLLLSEDQAKTWREIPRPGMVPIVLSPDGKQVWAIAPTGLLELVGDQWQSRMTMPTDGVRPLLPLNDGLWLVPHGSGIAYLKDGKFTPIPGLPAGAYAHALRDGTVVVGTGTGAYVGVGNGMDRQWFIVG